MNPMIHRTVICLVVLVGLSMQGYPGEQRNYWAECFSSGKESQDEFNRYVDGLSVEEVLVLGKQAAEECERKLKEVSSDDKTKVENEYVIALGLILGRFIQRAKTSDSARLFTEAIRDSEAPLFWRKALIHMTPELQDMNPDVVRWKDYTLVGILGEIMKSPSEDAELRIQSCRVTALILQEEWKRPPKSDKEKEVLANRIRENIGVCRVVLKDANAPSPLIDMVAETLCRYKVAGISEDQ